MDFIDEMGLDSKDHCDRRPQSAIIRLSHIADKFPSLRYESLKYICEYCQKLGNFQMYKVTSDKIDKTLPPQGVEKFVFDHEWYEKSLREYSLKENNLVSESRMAMGAGNNDSIKNSSWELAKLCNQTGQFKKSCKFLKDILQYAMPSEVAIISQEILEACINDDNYESLQSNLMSLITPSTKTNAKCLDHSKECPLPYVSYCEALCKFRERQWSLCLSILCQLHLEQHDHIFNNLITPRDACAMIVICSFFCYSRNDFTKTIINNPNLCFVLASDLKLLNLLKCIEHCDHNNFSRIFKEALNVIKMNHYTFFCHDEFQRKVLLIVIKEYFMAFSIVKIEKILKNFDISYNELESLIFQLNDNEDLYLKIDYKNQMIFVMGQENNSVELDRLVDGSSRITNWLENKVAGSLLKCNITCSTYKHERNLQ